MPVSEMDPGIMRQRVARMAQLADVRLRGMAGRLEPQDAELSHRIRDLARCNLLTGVTDEISTAVASLGERVNELARADLFDGEGFVAGMDTGDFRPFIEHLAAGFDGLPPAVNQLWYGRDLRSEDLDALSALGADEPTTWWTTLVTMINLTNELIALFGHTTEEHRYTCGPVGVRTLSLLETGYTGIESDRSKQPFQAKYVVEFDGDVSEACITFNCRFEGSRLGKVDYPMTAKATLASGAALVLTPEIVADSDYNELHKVAIAANARTVGVSVNGTAHWADWLGFLSGVSSLPHGKLSVDGEEYAFGDRDGIWTYGWSK